MKIEYFLERKYTCQCNNRQQQQRQNALRSVGSGYFSFFCQTKSKRSESNVNNENALQKREETLKALAYGLQIGNSGSWKIRKKVSKG